MANVTAVWSISLDVECPQCNHGFDLAEDPDFWHCQDDGFQAGDDANDVAVTCPECGHKFVCDF